MPVKKMTRRQAAVDRLRALEQSISADYLIEDIFVHNYPAVRGNFHQALKKILADDRVSEATLTAIYNALWLTHRIGYNDALHPQDW
jgi:hypothetical protein